ncbi:PAS domain-containing protein, partial [Roseisolibacter sp. H3M3-2]|uniref:PAS domain-containing protein n=1 Tax=Roseisolibacter sp. H3M3-2 TaxID=3031323 RepID=UPI0023DC20BC
MATRRPPDPAPPDRPAADRLFDGGGEMGALMRAHDWSTSPLGAPGDWPQSLRSALSICLGSAFPIALYWGPELALVYNDAWSPIPGGKHPWALGRPAREVWPEIWETIGPLFAQVMATGEATRSQDQLLAMRRHGYVEECYFDYTFSPVRGEGGRIGGIFNAVLETTDRVIGERRLRTVRELPGRAAEARTPEEACFAAAATLAAAPGDLPFALLYLADEDGLRLEATAGLGGAEVPAPARASLAGDAAD